MILDILAMYGIEFHATLACITIVVHHLLHTMQNIEHEVLPSLSTATMKLGQKSQNSLACTPAVPTNVNGTMCGNSLVPP